MTFRLPETTIEHEAMIRRLAEDLRRKGYEDIRAAHQPGGEWPEPELVTTSDGLHSMRPDLEARRGSDRLLFEVETIDSITSRQTCREVEILAEVARTREDHFFYLVVPDSCKHLSLFLLRKMNVAPGGRIFILYMTPEGPEPSPADFGYSHLL
jgi:hypothetical protein